MTSPNPSQFFLFSTRLLQGQQCRALTAFLHLTWLCLLIFPETPSLQALDLLAACLPTPNKSHFSSPYPGALGDTPHFPRGLSSVFFLPWCISSRSLRITPVLITVVLALVPGLQKGLWKITKGNKLPLPHFSTSSFFSRRSTGLWRYLMLSSLPVCPPCQCPCTIPHHRVIQWVKSSQTPCLIPAGSHSLWSLPSGPR